LAGGEQAVLRTQQPVEGRLIESGPGHLPTLTRSAAADQREEAAVDN
jgi:hypothetical protein